CCIGCKQVGGGNKLMKAFQLLLTVFWIRKHALEIIGKIGQTDDCLLTLQPVVFLIYIAHLPDFVDDCLEVPDFCCCGFLHQVHILGMFPNRQNEVGDQKSDESRYECIKNPVLKQ